MKIGVIDPIQEKDLIDIKEYIDNSRDKYGDDDRNIRDDRYIEIMSDTIEMIKLIKRVRSGVTSVNLWVVIH